MLAGEVVKILPKETGAAPALLRPSVNPGASMTLELPLTTRAASVLPGYSLFATAAPSGADVILNCTSVRFRSARVVLALPTCTEKSRI